MGTTATTKLPVLGEQISGGKYAGITTGQDGALYALILLDDKPQANLSWKAAMAWAAELGADASLPTRTESALLFALLKSEFEPDWYWTKDEHPTLSGYAFIQLFGCGGQYDTSKTDKFRARAVRRLSIDSSILCVSEAAATA